METIYGTIVAVKHNGKLLLLKRSKDEINAGLWEFPKGTFENHDLIIHETAKRELKEETGLEAIDMRYLGDIKITSKGKRYFGYAYLVTNFVGNIILSSEHEDYRWLRRSELANYDLDEITQACIQIYNI